METQKPISAIPASLKSFALSKDLYSSIHETTGDLHIVNKQSLKTGWVAVHGLLLSAYINSIYLLHLFYR